VRFTFGMDGTGGCWDDDITSDDWDHSRKFPAFRTSKSGMDDTTLIPCNLTVSHISCINPDHLCYLLVSSTWLAGKWLGSGWEVAGKWLGSP